MGRGPRAGSRQAGLKFLPNNKEYVQMSADSRCKYVLEIGCQREKFTI